MKSNKIAQFFFIISIADQVGYYQNRIKSARQPMNILFCTETCVAEHKGKNVEEKNALFLLVPFTNETHDA